jgi:glycosyltransferase involved in cell wall biosynthesis
MNQEKPNIVQVTAYYPPHLGGMENCVQNISHELIKTGYKVSVYTSDQGLTGNEPLNGIQTNYLRSVELFHTPIIFNLFPKLMAIPKQSLIHVHISQAITPEVVLLISKLKNIPYIVHFHLDVDSSGKMGFLLKPYKRIFLTKVLQNAAKVIVLSNEQRDFVIKKYKLNKNKITVVPNGVAETFFRISQKAHPVKKILFVGRLAPQKNLPLLIEAVTNMKTPVEVDIVGEGEDRQKIIDLIKYRQLKNVTLHGKKTGLDLQKFYSESDLFVIPSIREGVSLAMLEAMAAGLPIVASDVPGMRTLIKNCGILVKNPNPQNYAKTLDLNLSDPEKLKTLSKLSRQTAQNYSWRKVVSQIEDVYTEIY